MMKDGDIIMMTRALLDDLCVTFDTSKWRDKYLFQIRSLQEDLDSSCVLAVAGRVKAGKSFLINSLLGVDLAMTGCTETTATINVFKKGRPASAELPILCEWIDGKKEWKPKSFLDSLQGTDENTLRTTSRIGKLVYYIEGNPLLEDVTLVDTPGIGAYVGKDGDDHQIQTETYFKLRERHESETKSLSNRADAVLYLFEKVPDADDKEFLDSLYDGGKGLTALNGIGVLSKVDKNIDQINNIPKYSKDFEKELFTIMPTSAAISRYLPNLSKATELRNELLRGFDNNSWLQTALGSQAKFLCENLPHCNIPLARRKEILSEFASNDLPWSVFKLIALELCQSENVKDTLNHLQDIAGIQPLKKLIDEHFFQRSRLIRANRVLNDLMHLLAEIQFGDYFLNAENNASLKDRCLKECESLSTPCRNMVFNLINQHVADLMEVKKTKEEVLSFRRRVEQLQASLCDINDRYITLQMVLAAQSQFSNDEFSELNNLFSGKTTDMDLFSRQRYWAGVCNMAAPNSIRQRVAIVAKKCYNKKSRNCD